MKKVLLLFILFFILTGFTSRQANFLTGSFEEPSIDIYAQDDFNDTNATSLDAHTMDVGNGWTEDVGDWSISSNVALNSTQTSSVVYYMATTDVNQSDYVIRTEVATKATGSLANYGGIVFRFSDTNNYITCVVDAQNNRFILQKRVSGSASNLALVNYTVRDTKYVLVEIWLNGSDITVYIDGGYKTTVSDSFNSTADKCGLLEVIQTTHYVGNTFEDFQVVELPNFPWTSQGVVMEAEEAPSHENGNIWEPTVFFEGNAQIIDTEDPVFKMWYTGGWGSLSINYAESEDGLTWTKYGDNPIIEDIARSDVLKYNGTYYLYGVDAVNSNAFDLYTSNNGVDYDFATANILTLGTSGAWDDYAFGNISLFAIGGIFYALYDGAGDPVNVYWEDGLASSTDGLTWTKYASNPVLPKVRGILGASNFFRYGNYYYNWLLTSPHDVNLPTCIMRYRSSDLHTWTPHPNITVIPRIGTDEGGATFVGQTADPCCLIVNQTAYLFYSAGSDGGSISGNSHISLYTAGARAAFDW